MPSVPPIPVELWNQIPPVVQAAILGLVQQYEQRLQALQRKVDQLTERLNQNSTNSSRPPSSDPPHVKRRPPKPSSGRKKGSQPGHARQQRGRASSTLPPSGLERRPRRLFHPYLPHSEQALDPPGRPAEGEGLYYRAIPTAFGPSRPNIARIRSLPVRGKGVFPAGAAAGHALGFTTQNPARVEVATDGLSLPRLIVGQETVVHTRRPECWRTLSQTDAALLDFLRNRGQSSELSPEETVAKLLGYLKEPGRFERLRKVAPSEPPRVRAMLGALGQQLGQAPNRLLTLRKSLNPLSPFDFVVLVALEYARQWQAKDANPVRLFEHPDFEQADRREGSRRSAGRPWASLGPLQRFKLLGGGPSAATPDAVRAGRLWRRSWGGGRQDYRRATPGPGLGGDAPAASDSWQCVPRPAIIGGRRHNDGLAPPRPP